MTDRYFTESPIDGSTVHLEGSEAHHLAHVMRAKPGGRVVVFDGSGREFDATVKKIARASIELEVIDSRQVDRELPQELTLGVALPKGDRQRWLVEKAVELGVSRLTPLVVARGVAQPADRSLDRLRRAVIEASKQCGRNRLMAIEEPRRWETYLTEAPPTAHRLIAHPSGAPFTPPPADQAAAWYVAIGPEGGFTDDEVAQAAQHGWHPVSLGPRILRIETAALYLASLVACSGQGRDANQPR